MASQTAHTLINKQNGNLAFKVFDFDSNSCFDHVQRNNYFTLILVTGGTGKAKVDFSEYDFGANTFFSFYPYQPFMLSATTAIEGYAIHFHHDFFCIHRHQKEIGSNGILFNNIYEQPFIFLAEDKKNLLLSLITHIIDEFKTGGIQQEDVITSYLKVLLITATRVKIEQQSISLAAKSDNRHLFILQSLREAIEENFKQMHSAGEYASLLNISPGNLAKITKTCINKTISDLIAERIVIEAKRELYLTKKTVKEIAFDLGYEDEYYFSRFFKSNAEVSPQLYRETIGFGRGDS